MAIRTVVLGGVLGQLASAALSHVIDKARDEAAVDEGLSPEETREEGVLLLWQLERVQLICDDNPDFAQIGQRNVVGYVLLGEARVHADEPGKVLRLKVELGSFQDEGGNITHQKPKISEAK